MATDKNKVSAYLDDLDFQLLGELAGNYRVSKSQIISQAIRAMPLHPNQESGVNTSNNAVTQVALPDNSTIESLVEKKLESLFKGVINGTVESEKEKELVELLSSVINSQVESSVGSRINEAMALQKPTLASYQADLPTTEPLTASTEVFNTHEFPIEFGQTIEDEELSFPELSDLTSQNQDIPPQTNPSSDKKDIKKGEGVEDNKNVIEVGEVTQRFTDREVQRILQQEKILTTSTQNITKWRKGQSNPRGLNKKILDHFKPDGDRWIRLPS